MKYINTAPNFSIIVPGGCNAKCEFCFWDRDPLKIKEGSGYAKNLSNVLENLPSCFKTISITGGEPTASKSLSKVLACIEIHRARFDRVILTTNGYKIEKIAPSLRGIVDYVNLSRHDVDNNINQNIFKSETVPNDLQLEQAIFELNQVGIPVTLSKVISDTDTKVNIYQYIEFAKSVGATSVFFRKPHGNLDPHPIELNFANLYTREHGCPVCLSMHQIIKGMPVEWKRGLLEPSTVGYHELIMQASGKTTLDWDGKLPITMAKIYEIFEPKKTATKTKVPYFNKKPLNIISTSTGCGGFSGGCGGGGSRGGCG